MVYCGKLGKDFGAIFGEKLWFFVAIKYKKITTIL